MDAKQADVVRQARRDVAPNIDASLRSPSHTTARPRFPVVAITGQTLSLLMRNVGHYLRVALPGALLLLVVWLIYQQTDPSQSPPTSKRAYEWWVATQTALIALMALTPLMIAIPWHRRVILGPAAPRAKSYAYARYGVRVALFVFFLTFVPNNVYLGAMANGLDAFTAGLVYAAYYTLCAVVVCRFALTLPAVACEATPAGMFASWAMTRGNALRIFVGCVFLVWCVDMFYRSARVVLGGIVGTFAIPEASAPAAAILSALTWTLAIGLLATYFSLAHRFFAGPRDDAALRDVFS